MSKLCKTLFFVFLGFFSHAQSTYTVRLQSGNLAGDEGNTPESITPAQLESVQYGAHYYVLLQFSDIPDSSLQASLAEQGVTLHAYIPEYTFVARIAKAADLASLPVRNIFPLSGTDKLSPELAAGDYPLDALTENGIEVSAFLFPDLDTQPVLSRLSARGYEWELTQDVLRMHIPLEDIPWLAEQPYILYLAPAPPAPRVEPEGLQARALQRINLVSRGPGNGLDGQGVEFGVGDDGSIDHLDINDRMIDLTTTDYGEHAEMTIGILAGGGHIDPLAMGMAPAATVRLFDIDGYTHLFEAPKHYQQHRTVITSTSYGEGCGGVYTVNTRNIDQQIYDHPALLHVFSVGNKSTQACSNNYGKINSPDGLYYGNVTGGMKAGKNVIAVGNVESFDNLQIRSSRGPATDGRIKPDICAMGQGQYTLGEQGSYQTGSGSSASAPSLAGGAGLVYQAFRQKNGGQDPSSALVKALLLNTADDLGRPGPDYEYGWGRVNIGRAVEAVEQQQYLSGSVRHRGTQTHTIQVPAGVGRLRVMVYWHDPAGTPLAGRALVNDLDMMVRQPSGPNLLPWRLSTTARLDSLRRPAWRGVDRFNNVEQVTLDTPIPGTYSVEVKGHLVPKGPQNYVLVYYFEKPGLAITYPAEGEGLVPGDRAVVRWDALDQQGGYTLEFSPNNGQSWQMISNKILPDEKQHEWSVPNQSTGQARLRLRRGNQSTLSQPFAILGIPEFSVQYHDDQHARMDWKQVPGATSYDIFQLRNGSMQQIGSTSQTSFLLPQNGAWQQSWYSIRSRNTQSGATGRRAVAQNYVHRFCEREITVRIRFDFYPGETSWDIKSDDGSVLASGGDYDGTYANREVVFTECLPTGCFTFTIYDAFGDGICCTNGNGYYQIIDENGELLASGGKFSSQDEQSFCLDPPSSLSVQIQELQAIDCPGGQNGTLSAIVTGAGSNVSYQWSNNATTPVITNLTAGTYQVTVTDGSNQRTASYQLSAPDELELLFIREHNDCAGQKEGRINLLAQGGTAPYTYQWSTGQTSAQLNRLAGGTYRVTVTDSKNCLTTGLTQIQEPPPVNVAEAVTQPTCADAADATIELTVAGGVPPYQIAWNDGHQGKRRDNLAPGRYTYQLIDDNGCSYSGSVRIQRPASLTLQLSRGEASCASSLHTVFAQATGGQPPYSYQWSDGVAQNNRTDLPGGNYTVTATDANGCSATQSIELATTSTLSVLLTQTDVSCHGAADGILQAVVQGGEGPYTYQWSAPGLGDGAFAKNLEAGTYQVTVTDANGCSTSSQTRIEAPAPIALRLETTDADCGQGTGSARVMVQGGQLPYQFTWSNGSKRPQAGELPPGIHQVTVTDANGCSSSESVTIASSEGPDVQIERRHPSCPDTRDGRLQAVVSGGEAPYSYAWSAGGSLPVRSQLAAGSYVVTVTDAAGCQTIQETSLEAPNPIRIELQATDVSCHAGQDGAIDAAVRGGTGTLSYAWSHGARSVSTSDLPAGRYTLTVTDEAGCALADSVRIEQPAPLALLGIVTNPPCKAESTGAINVSVSGGRKPYSYQWDSGQRSAGLQNLRPGAYQLVVTDAAGCSIQDSFVLEDANELAIAFEPLPPSCADGQDGIIYTSVEGTSGIYTLQWSNGSTDPSLIDVAADTYYVTVVDNNQCTRTDSVVLQAPEPLSVDAALTPAAPEKGGSIQVEATGGTSPYTYLWSNGATTRNLEDVPAGSYRLTVTDANGCTRNVAYTLLQLNSSYCEHAARNSNYEWIEALQLGKYSNQSGNDGGYGDFTGQTISVQAGQTYPLTLTPGYGLRPYYENWYVWIDLNGDRDFTDPDELVLHTRARDVHQTTLTIPHLAQSSTTRMRIAMRFLEDPASCGTFSYGEVEDYTLHIDAGATEYCVARGATSDLDWIQAVTLGGDRRNTGPNDGYHNQTATPFYADPNTSTPLRLELGNRRTVIDQYWRVWVDFNQNGVFTGDELMVAERASGPVLEKILRWPAGLSSGQYRMRVLLKWGTPPLPCESFYWGEVEDYTLNLRADAESWFPAVYRPGDQLEVPAAGRWSLKAFPNPSTGTVQVSWQQEAAWDGMVQVVNMQGQRVWQQPVHLPAGQKELTLELGNLPAGRYELIMGAQQIAIQIIR